MGVSCVSIHHRRPGKANIRQDGMNGKSKNEQPSRTNMRTILKAKGNLRSKPDWKTRQPVTEERTAPVLAKPATEYKTNI